MNYFGSSAPNFTGTMNNTTVMAQAGVMIGVEIDMDTYRTQRTDIDKAAEVGYMPFYNVPCTNNHLAVIQGDLLMQVKTSVYVQSEGVYKNLFSGKVKSDGVPLVINTLNMAGFKSDDGLMYHLYKNKKITKSTFMRFMRSFFRFVGAANAYWNIGPGGLQAENERLDISCQIGGLGPARAGPLGADTNQWQVWNLPDMDELYKYYPQLENGHVNNSITRTRESTQVLFCLEPFDPKQDFNLDLLYEAHSNVFDSCIGYVFPEKFDYIPNNPGQFDYDISIEGYHKALYTNIFSMLAAYDTMVREYPTDIANPQWKGPMSGEDTQKFLLGTQNKLARATDNFFETEEQELTNLRLHKGTLLALEMTYFAEKSKIFRSATKNLQKVSELKKMMSKSASSLFNIQSFILIENCDRIVCKTTRGGRPGTMIDVQWGGGRTAV